MRKYLKKEKLIVFQKIVNKKILIKIYDNENKDKIFY